MAFKKCVRNSFNNVKKDVESIQNTLKTLKEAISTQNEFLTLLKDEIINLKEKKESDQKNHSNTQNKQVPQETKGLNQSLNHLINQSINHLITPKTTNSPEFKCFREDLSDELNQILSTNQSHLNRISEESPEDIFIDETPIHEAVSEPQISFETPRYEQFGQSLSEIKTDYNKIFSSLTKQELKVFLTIYQLEDEGLAVTYAHIADRIKLSEPCIRGYISGLLKKRVPFIKTKSNNKLTFLKIKPELRDLNLKRKLISLYYGFDPHQKRLFDTV